MSGLVILVVSFVIFLVAYFGYGRWLAKKWGVDANAPTPAHELRDGVDYVLANRSVVFGHQFASIAGAGPINGPIIAAMFGWVPVLLWIIVGGIFFGAVQDFAAMYASVKNKGKTIGYLIELYIGKTGKRLFLAFNLVFTAVPRREKPYSFGSDQFLHGFCGVKRIRGEGAPFLEPPQKRFSLPLDPLPLPKKAFLRLSVI